MIHNKVWGANLVAPSAFPQRSALMPIWGGIDAPEEQWESIWREAVVDSLNQDGLAYVHIPFCISHCVFCGFYRNAWKEDQGTGYVDKVIQELAYEAEIRQDKGKIKAVYFGGGTPTALDTANLTRLIRACYQYLPLADDCEFTLEGRISHFDLEKAQASIEAGVNRISIGIQTFNSPIRKRLGRRHSGEQAYEYLTQLCQLDATVVADLIFGLPEQTDEIWEKDIEIATSLPLSGLDTYAFNCYPFLPINKLIKHGTIAPPVGLEMQAYHYAYAVTELQQRGWKQVSNNHFAFPDRGERNYYNSKVKSNMPCLAFGSGAGGSFAGFNYQVQGDLQSYLATSKDHKNISYLGYHSAKKDLFSQLQFSTEIGWLDTKLFPNNQVIAQLLENWQNESLLSIDSQGIAHLTTSGKYWSPTIIRTLMLSLTDSQ